MQPSIAFRQALEDCSAVHTKQINEIPNKPTFGAQYGYEARRVLAMELCSAAKNKSAFTFSQRIVGINGTTQEELDEINAIVSKPGRGQKNGTLFSYMIRAIEDTGVSRLTIQTWLHKYSNLFDAPTRG